MRRRSFTTALLSLIAGVGFRPARSTRATLPTRPLGRTGLDVTILGLGGHHVAVSGSEANARRAARLHRDLKPSVASADVQGQNYWRVASGPYSADRAQEIAQRLRDGGLHDALVVRDAGKANQAGVATRNGSQVAALR